MSKFQHDAHFHLDLYTDISKIVNEIERKQSYTIAVTNLPPLYKKLEKIINSEFIRVALGFHPELVTQYKKYIPQMWQYLSSTRYIGEVGLDLKNKPKTDSNNQVHFFKELINQCNSIGGKIISVHSRGSEKELLSIFNNGFNGNIILHWYSGSLKNLDNAIEKGFYFSVNYAMLQSMKGKKVIERIPINRILIESDGPFIKINKKFFHPNDLDIIIQNLAKLKREDLSEMKNILSQNFKQLLLT